MKKLSFLWSALALTFFLHDGCATTHPDLSAQTLKKLPEICTNYDYTSPKALSDTYPDVYKRWRAFDVYYDASQAPKGRKLAVFFDGTDNNATDSTNIWVLYKLAVAQACRGNPVIPYYDKGVGSKWFEIFDLGDIFGTGVSLNIRQAYRFLSQTYRTANENEPVTNNDEIYIFGFSRGAFTARSLNGFIEFAGLLDSTKMKNDLPVALHWITSSDWIVKNVYDQYHVKSDGNDLKNLIKAYEQKQYPEHEFRDVKVQAIGVFDTVPALGFELIDNPKNHKLDLYANKGFHALALDEQRKQFKLLRFNEALVNKEQVLHEIWFAGGHSNIGGGYANMLGCNTLHKDSTYYDGLEATPLNWMIDQFEDEHLFPNIAPPFSECVGGKLHDEYYDSKVPYKISRPLPRMPHDGDVIHESVKCRMEIKKLELPHPKREEPNHQYHPKNLPKLYTIGPVKLGQSCK